MKDIGNAEYVEWAANWTKKAEEHRVLAEFCDAQAAKYLGKVVLDLGEQVHYPDDSHQQ